MENLAENKAPRTKAEIDQDYASVCSHAGDKQYRIETLKNDLLSLNQRLFELNKEYAESNGPDQSTPLKAVDVEAT